MTNHLQINLIFCIQLIKSHQQDESKSPQGAMAGPQFVDISAETDEEDEEDEQESSAMDNFEVSSYQNDNNSSMDLSSSTLDTSLEIGTVLF